MAVSRRYDSARVVLGDADERSRHHLKGALFSQGFRRIFETGEMGSVDACLSSHMVDLVVCDADSPEGRRSLGEIRTRAQGDNAFAVVVALTAEAGEGSVRSLIDAGADAILLKPVAAPRLAARIEALVRGRAEFIVTSGYVGPDRRPGARKGDAPAVAVPNPLGVTVLGTMSRAQLQREVRKAWDEVNDLRVGLHARRLRGLVREIGASCEIRPPKAAFRLQVDELGRLSRDLCVRVGAEPGGTLSSLTATLVGAGRRLEATIGDPDPNTLAVLPELAEAVLAALGGARDQARAARQISETVERHAGARFEWR